MISWEDAKKTLESWEGLSGRHPEEEIRIKTAETIMPHDNIRQAMNYLYGYKNEKGEWKIVSTCAIVSMAYLDQILSVKHPRLQRPYLTQVGSAISNIKEIGQDLGLWVSGKALEDTPELGDIDCIDNASSTNPHVMNNTGYIAENGVFVFTDGGQVDNSYIKKVERKMVYRDNGVYWVSAGNTEETGRRLYGRLKASRLSIR